jgi:oligoribonuclease NrnB/cAMP/cGMP phosphodiesterase (DHH superfamily)
VKTYLFTHSDLDGVGCAVLATLAFGPQPEDLEITYVNYHTVNNAIMNFIADRAGDDQEFRLMITDIAPEGKDREIVAEAINVLHASKRAKVFLCDHHSTSSWIKKYPWAQHDMNYCGTQLVLDHLERGQTAFFGPNVREFAEMVCVYDNWKLTHPARPRSESVNRYLYFIGFDSFVREFAQNPEADLEPSCARVVGQLRRNEESYVNKVIERQCRDDFVLEDRDGHKYCILVAEKNVSQVCHGALDAFSELDYAMCLNPSYDKGDLRSREGGVDVSKVAEKLGGGGRQATAGFQMPFQNVLKLTLKNAI